MLDKIKLALRITNTAFDDEIEIIIKACKKDLDIAGVQSDKDNDPLIERAVILYSKANFGFSDDGEKYQRSYDMLKSSLSLAGDYNALG